MRNQLLRISALISICALSACGGGGGSESPNPTPAPQNLAPVANAGPGQTVDEGAVVILDATASTDSDGDSLTYAWSQTIGPNVTLVEHAEGWAKATFTAPSVPGGTELTFEVAVSDGSETTTDVVTVAVKDITAPGGTLSNTSALLGKTEAIVVTFTEAIDPASLSLDGTLATEADIAWSDGNKTLTLTPNAGDDEWISGSGRTLRIDAEDTAGNALATLEGEWLVKLVFENFQAAETVIGQHDFESFTGAFAADRFTNPRGIVYQAPWLYVSDMGDRILGFDGIPTANGASASVILGLNDFVTTSFGATPTDATHLDTPLGLAVANGHLYVADSDHFRVAVYEEPTVGAPGLISRVIGQADKVSNDVDCTADTTGGSPASVTVAGGRLIVADLFCHRVLIWNSLPETDGVAADLVLGQTAFDHDLANDSNHNDVADVTDGPDATTLNFPQGVWSDGERLVIADSGNHRVLVWNSFPTANGQAADLVLGQGVFDLAAANDDDQDNVTDQDGGGQEIASARSMNIPIGVYALSDMLFVADSGNHRLLVWNDFPTTSFTPADVVLGQSDMQHKIANDTDQNFASDPEPDARTFFGPRTPLVVDDRLLVPDNANRRVLIFRSQ